MLAASGGDWPHAMLDGVALRGWFAADPAVRHDDLGLLQQGVIQQRVAARADRRRSSPQSCSASGMSVASGEMRDDWKPPTGKSRNTQGFNYVAHAT